MKKLTVLLLIFVSIAFARTIPDFTLKDENGKIVKSEDLKGKPSVLIFWGLNCSSCKKELPIFNKYYHLYKDKINFYAIVIDTNNLEEIKQRKEYWKFDIPVLIDGKKIMYKYRIFGVPITYIVDENLNRKKILIGKVPESKIKKTIEDLLKK